jgi:hypothetical protein
LLGRNSKFNSPKNNCLRFSFKDHDIRKVCEDSDTATNKYGISVADVLRIRLADLEAATTIADLLSGNPGIVPNTPYSLYKVDLAKNLQLFFGAHHVKKPPLDKNKDINWAIVNYIQILEIR